MKLISFQRYQTEKNQVWQYHKSVFAAELRQRLLGNNLYSSDIEPILRWASDQIQIAYEIGIR